MSEQEPLEPSSESINSMEKTIGEFNERIEEFFQDPNYPAISQAVKYCIDIINRYLKDREIMDGRGTELDQDV